MADRKERVKAMDALFHKIPDYRVALKLKVLATVRTEVAHPIQSTRAAERAERHPRAP